MPDTPIEEQPETQPAPRKRLAETVAEEVAAQRELQSLDAIDEAAAAEPAFDKRSGTSNFGKRVSARLQQAFQS